MSLRSERRQRRIVERAPQVDDRHPGEARADPLSYVFGRAHFEARLSEEFEEARRSGDDFVLIYFDIDDFEVLNYVHGRRMGDEALTLLARVLVSNARQADVVARYENDEFVVLMPATPLVEARKLFEKVRKEVAELSARTLGFTLLLSAGAVKLFHDDASAHQYFLEEADHAMYVAKHQGSDHFFATVAVGCAEKGREMRRGA